MVNIFIHFSLFLFLLSIFHFSFVFLYFSFLVACYATLHPALSVRRSVGPSVGPSVHPSVGPSVRHTLLFFGFLRSLASLLLPK